MTSGDGKGQQAVARVGRILHPRMGRLADMNRMMRWRVLVVLIVLAPALLVTSSQGQAPRKGVIVVDFEDVGRGWSYTREVITAPRVSKLAVEATLRGLPRGQGKKTQTSVSIWIGPWWTDVTVNNFDGQLIGRATQEAVEDFIGKLKPSLK